ncbi:hypothetical protein Poli38472_011315 [Pythium oligandrum]|uniref:Uncharacterized protein n=1 Tax=Pythium oligandrum TaxID=41045 RepID=A0A8K1FL03_PYTOL|nr:hypothetical protein Poli38472_011315 [Pythium oligandrum]|eukprot:TMW67695.1 hypothetical protein Poli38472_011315 [Pythium oligandrum]
MGFRVHRVSAVASTKEPSNLTQYTRRTCWESFARPREYVVLAIDTKTLLSEICILNKNACTVDVSISVEDRPRSYIKVKKLQHVPHGREIRISIGFLPCSFVKLEFARHTHPSIAVYGVQLHGVASQEIENVSGPSLCTQLSHKTEHLLFGPSLRSSLPYRDCLSEHYSGCPHWMERQRPLLLDERIARMEEALFS